MAQRACSTPFEGGRQPTPLRRKARGPSGRSAAYRVASRPRKNWTITRFRDYVEKPKPDGYRALHLINRNRGRLIEIQLRTPRQNQWANTVEACARVAPGLKSGGGPLELREFFSILGEVFARLDHGVEGEDSLRAQIEELRERAEELQERADTFERLGQ